jgi:hypothetical protein
MTAAARAVVSDDGSTIWLTTYSGAGDAVPVALHPTRAITIAHELLGAAVQRLTLAGSNSTTRPAPSKRGGDPRAQQRRQRDSGIRALARLVGNGKPLGRQAQEIAGSLARYRPMPQETSPERRLMQEIAEAGLPIGADRIRKILGKQ